MPGNCKLLVGLTLAVVLWSAAAARGQNAPDAKVLPAPPDITAEPSLDPQAAACPIGAPESDDVVPPNGEGHPRLHRLMQLLRSRTASSETPTCSPWQESWNEHPWGIGWFVGGVQGSPLIDDWVGMDRGFLLGVRGDCDFSEHLGGAIRLGFGSADIYDSDRAVHARALADTAAGLTPASPFWGGTEHRSADLFQGDADVLYYPWGDTRWRPYVTAGIGATHVHFFDRLDVSEKQWMFSVPVGLGLKYLWTDRLALRLECLDDIALGTGGISTVQDVSLTAGIELRLGGARRLYWPWDPGRQYW